MESIEDNYSRYAERFERLVGSMNAGQFGNFKGRLVRRMNEAQFHAKLVEYKALGDQLSAAVMSGDTIDERLSVQIRAFEFELVLERSNYLP